MMNQHSDPVSIFWFRRDLRLADNAGLFHALKSKEPILPVFIFDRNILDGLKDRKDRRVTFIHQILTEIHSKLQKQGSGLTTFYSTPEEAFALLSQQYQIKAVYTNHDYEPYALQRDVQIGKFLKERNIELFTFKDQVIFEKDEVLSNTGTAYSVFTPYSKKWKALFRTEMAEPYDTDRYLSHFLPYQAPAMPTLEQMNFETCADHLPPAEVSDSLICAYGEKRNFPAIPGTSRLSVHLRFGTVSIRQLVQRAFELSEPWLNELIWRDFYMSVLWHFPQVGEGKAFKPAYDRIRWRNNPEEFKAWCEGKTGYPIVDAGMRELNTTGFMHNRVRMITASFLVKHLLIDWRWGESYFAEKLIDFDLSANNGGWQWAAGSGCDAAPYFRVFNPLLQTQKFDPQLAYIRKWVPECNDLLYMQQPIVNHEFARNRALATFKEALGNNT